MGILKAIFGLFSEKTGSEAPKPLSSSFEFELVSAFTSDKGSGYYVRRNSDQKILTWRGLPKSMTTFRAAGISFYRSKDPYIDPGVLLRLVPEPKNKHDKNAVKIVDVYDMKIGYVPAEKALAVGEGLRTDRYQYCISVWSKEWDEKLVEVRVLLVDKGVSLGLPTFTRRQIEKHSC